MPVFFCYFVMHFFNICMSFMWLRDFKNTLSPFTWHRLEQWVFWFFQILYSKWICFFHWLHGLTKPWVNFKMTQVNEETRIKTFPQKTSNSDVLSFVKCPSSILIRCEWIGTRYVEKIVFYREWDGKMEWNHLFCCCKADYDLWYGSEGRFKHVPLLCRRFRTRFFWIATSNVVWLPVYHSLLIMNKFMLNHIIACFYCNFKVSVRMEKPSYIFANRGHAMYCSYVPILLDCRVNRVWNWILRFWTSRNCRSKKRLRTSQRNTKIKNWLTAFNKDHINNRSLPFTFEKVEFYIKIELFDLNTCLLKSAVIVKDFLSSHILQISQSFCTILATNIIGGHALVYTLDLWCNASGPNWISFVLNLIFWLH